MPTASLKARLGIDGVVCGPGGRYNIMPDERVAIADYLDALRIYPVAMADICGLARRGDRARPLPTRAMRA